MARPKKNCLEYFSLDVVLDEETQLIIAQHGMEGYGILISMFQTIYGNEGYYHNWTEREQILFSNKVSVSKNTVVEVINDCIKWGIFDQEQCSRHKILTSRRIQQHYLDVTYRRSEVKINVDYLVIDKVDRDNIIYTGVFDSKNPTGDKVSDNKSTQSNIVSSNIVSSKKEKKDDVSISVRDYILKKVQAVELSKMYLLNEDLQQHPIEIIKKACDLAVAQKEEKGEWRGGTKAAGVNITSYKFIRCFISEAQEILERGDSNGGLLSEDSKSSNSAKPKHRARRI